MNRIRMTKEAERNLAQIRALIALDSKETAKRFVQKLRTAIRSVRRFPEAGSLVPDFDRTDLRETFVGSYRIIYHIKGSDIFIVKVIHGARQLPDSLGRL